MSNKQQHLHEPLFNKSTIKAIVGIGNPGAKYYKTRHSIGLRIIDALADESSLIQWSSQENLVYAHVSLASFTDQSHMVYLIKSLTYMNESGKIMAFLQKKGIKPEEIVVAHDELEKPFGKVLMKFNGSPRGHNGLRSIINSIGKDFWRLCFGIGRPLDREEVSDYVLNSFSFAEEREIPALLSEAIKFFL